MGGRTKYMLIDDTIACIVFTTDLIIFTNLQALIYSGRSQHCIYALNTCNIRSAR